MQLTEILEKLKRELGNDYGDRIQIAEMAGVHRNTVTNVLNGKTQGRSMKAVIDAAKEHLKLKTEAISNELDEIAEKQERLRTRAKELATQI